MNNYNNQNINMNNNQNNNINRNHQYNNQPRYINNQNNVAHTETPLSYYIKRFLLGFILVALLIFILLWLFPTKAGINNNVDEAVSKTVTEQLKPLYDKMFQDNIDTMRNVATAYYTKDKLPTQDGQKVKITLGKMIEKKLLLSITDKKGKMCDPDDSYVQVTKIGNEYKMKINLACDGEEDYIVSYLGCYNYCLNDICEKQEVTKARQVARENYGYSEGQSSGYSEGQSSVINTISTKIKTITKIIIKTKKVHPNYYCSIVNGKYYGKTGSVVTKSVYKNQCLPKPVPAKHYCAVVNGKYYDNKGKVVSKAAYQKACESTPPKHYCAIVNNVYYGKDGKVVSEEVYKEQCTTPPEPEKYYCSIVNGKYYDSKGNEVTKGEYEEDCTTPPEPEKYYCSIVNGKYYDSKGNEVTKDEYEEDCVTPAPEVLYRYLYEKIVSIHHDKEYSKWTDWSDNIEYNPDSNNINWGEHEYEWNEKVGYKLTKYYSYEPDTSQPIYNTYYDRLLGYEKEYACNGYNYYIDVTTNITYYTTGTVASGWSKTGRVTTTTKPSSSSSKRYVYVGMNYNYCTSNCSLKPYYIYDVYSRSGSTATTSMASKSYATVKAVCKDVVTKEIPIYGQRTEFAGYVTNKVYNEKRVYYYHKKTRTLVKDAYTENKKYQLWSYSDHDESLINQGYEYTGISERIN